MPLKIGLISPRFLDEDMRGGEEAVRTLFNHIHSRHTVSVLTSDTVDVSAQHSLKGRKTKQKRLVTDSRREVLYFKSDPVLSTFCHYSYFLTKGIFRKAAISPASFKILDLLRIYGSGPIVHSLSDHISASHYDVIHGSIFPTTISFQALKATKNAKRRFVYTPYYHYMIPEFYTSPMLKWIARNSDALIACTEAEKAALIRLGALSDRVYVIPLAFDLGAISKFRSSPEKSKRELNLQGKFVILTHPWRAKGVISLLRAVKLLSKKHNNIALLTIGEPDKAYLSERRRLLSQHERFTILDLGWVSGTKKWVAFGASDLFSMVSIFDAFGLSYLNAWAVEKPVVGARNSFAEGVIKNGIDGMLVNRDDDTDLAKTLDMMIMDSNLRIDMGRRGRSRLDWEFHPHRIAVEHERVYETLMNK
jgi:glycosyltransferase involved in cell wall biosynthesis